MELLNLRTFEAVEHIVLCELAGLLDKFGVLFLQVGIGVNHKLNLLKPTFSFLTI